MAQTTKAQSAATQASPCPNCGSDQLTPAAEDTALCLSCRRCWRVGAGIVRWVSPPRCPGCALRPLCSEPLASDAMITVLSVPVRQRGRRSRRHPHHKVDLDLTGAPLLPGA